MNNCYVLLAAAGGWCWFGVREKYCWLADEAASRTEGKNCFQIKNSYYILYDKLTIIHTCDS